MRKFPVYSFIQEINTQLMATLLIIGYIAYDLSETLGSSSYFLLGLCAAVIVFLFLRQIKSMKTAKIMILLSQSNLISVRKNALFVVLTNTLLICLSACHFVAYYLLDKGFEPLYNEYGFGALLGLVLWWYNHRNTQIILTDQGVAVGSKIDLRLILWEDLALVQKTNQVYLLSPKAHFSVKEIKIPATKETAILEHYLTGK